MLQRAGLIEQGRQAQWRPCRLKAAPLKDAAKWIGSYRKFWEESYDRLDELLQELQVEGAPKRARSAEGAPKRARSIEKETNNDSE